MEEGYHLSKDLADRAIGMIADAKQVAPDKPFFIYYAPGAGHAPHHAPKEWADKYKGVFDWNGGVCDPLILSWPDKIKDHGGVRDQYCHDIDLVPTIYEALGI